MSYKLPYAGKDIADLLDKVNNGEVLTTAEKTAIQALATEFDAGGALITAEQAEKLDSLVGFDGTISVAYKGYPYIPASEVTSHSQGVYLVTGFTSGIISIKNSADATYYRDVGVSQGTLASNGDIEFKSISGLYLHTLSIELNSVRYVVKLISTASTFAGLASGTVISGYCDVVVISGSVVRGGFMLSGWNTSGASYPGGGIDVGLLDVRDLTNLDKVSITYHSANDTITFIG